MRTVHADAVLTGDAEVIADGAVALAEDGTVVEVGRAANVLPAHAGLTVERVRGVVFPGLVNAHTHLELSALRGRVPGGRGFVDWVERLLGVRAESAPEEDEAAIGGALDALHAAGTAAVGEVTNSLAAVRGLRQKGVAGMVFHEVFGVVRDQAMARVDALGQAALTAFGPTPDGDLAYAPAPHTLYTTHPDAVRTLLSLARGRGVRSTLHLAEHAAERRAIEAGDGPVGAWLGKMGLPALSPRVPLFAYAESLGALGPDVLLVHLTDARRNELDLVAQRGNPVVLCPRSNLHIEAKLPPLLALREAGIAAALGTDSLASNASLDVLAEARALADRFPIIPAKELVRMATWNGACALGRPDLGRIAKGARPGIVAVLGEPGDDPAAFLLKSVKQARHWVARRGSP